MAQEQVLEQGSTSGTIYFDPQPVFQKHLVSAAVRDRIEVEIEAMEVSLGDLETYSEALRKSRASGIAEWIARGHLISGHGEYQITKINGTVTLQQQEIDERLRAIYSPNAAIVYRFGEPNILSAFVVHARKAPEKLAA